MTDLRTKAPCFEEQLKSDFMRLKVQDYSIKGRRVSDDREVYLGECFSTQDRARLGHLHHRVISQLICSSKYACFSSPVPKNNC